MIRTTPILVGLAILEAVIIGILLGSRFQVSLTSASTKRCVRPRKSVRTKRQGPLG